MCMLLASEVTRRNEALFIKISLTEMYSSSLRRQVIFISGMVRGCGG